MKYSSLLSPKGMAAGGIATTAGGRVKGPGDGMSDSIPAQIDGEQPAAIATGEYVVSADVVSFLGNGDNDAGAKVLDDMVARIRQAKTGRAEQPPRIDPTKFLPR
jgi:hypothetical protein